MAETMVVQIRVDSAKANRDMKAMGANMKRTRTAAEAMRASFSKLNSALAILGGATFFGSMVKGAISLIDTYKEVGGRVKLVADYTVGLTKAQEDLNRVANETYSSYEGIATLYARMGMAMDGLGVSHKDMIDATRTVANTLRLSGASAQEARASMLQLSQALAKGVLDGDEFKSMSEGNTAFMTLLANALKVTRGELKEMGSKGLLTTAKIMDALTESTLEYSDLVKGLPVTVSRAMTVLTNNWTVFLDELDRGVISTTSISSAIILLAENLELVAKVVAAVALSFASPYITGFAATLLAGAKGAGVLTKAMVLFRGVMFSIGKILWWVAMIEGITLLIKELNKLPTIMRETGSSMSDMFLYYIETLINRTVGGLASLGSFIVAWGLDLNSKFLNLLSFEEAAAQWGAGAAVAYANAFNTVMTRHFKILDDETYKRINEFEVPDFVPKTKENEGATGGGGTCDAACKKQKTYMAALRQRIEQESIAHGSILKETQLIGESAIEQERLISLYNIRHTISKEMYRAEKAGIDVNGEAHKALMKEYELSLKSTAEFTAELAKQQALYDQSLDWAESFGDAIIDFSKGGKDAFKDFADSIINDLLRMMVRMTIVLPLAEALKSALSGGTGGIIGAISGAITGRGLGTGENPGVSTGGGNIAAFAGGGASGGTGGVGITPYVGGGTGGGGANAGLLKMPDGGGNNVTIINKSGGEVKTEEKPNGRGGMDVTVFIEKAVADYIGNGGADRMMGSAYGANRMPR